MTWFRRRFEEHEHVTAERIVAERVPDLVGEPLERLPQIRRLRGEVHPHCARQEDHDADLVSSRASAATQVGDTPSSSITMPLGSRITAAGWAMAAPITAAGMKVSAVVVCGRVATWRCGRGALGHAPSLARRQAGRGAAPMLSAPFGRTVTWAERRDHRRRAPRLGQQGDLHSGTSARSARGSSRGFGALTRIHLSAGSRATWSRSCWPAAGGSGSTHRRWIQRGRETGSHRGHEAGSQGHETGSHRGHVRGSLVRR